VPSRTGFDHTINDLDVAVENPDRLGEPHPRRRHGAGDGPVHPEQILSQAGTAMPAGHRASQGVLSLLR
jgi:hypothetical protein